MSTVGPFTIIECNCKSCRILIQQEISKKEYTEKVKKQQYKDERSNQKYAQKYKLK